MHVTRRSSSAERPAPVSVRGARRSALVAAFAAAVAAAAFAASAPGAGVSVPAAVRCSNLTLNIGAPQGRIPVRFVVIGSVTCARVHSLARAYFHKLATRQCGALNNFCNLAFPGGWQCSRFFVTEVPGAIGGCARSATVKFRFYPAHG